METNLMIYLRSFLFNVFFFLWTFTIVMGATPGLLLGGWYIRFWADMWGRGVNRLLGLVGITVEIRGREHVPSEPVIFASKHQSTWETAMVETLFRNSAIILKRELMYIPFFGWLLWRIGSIHVNRKKGCKVLPQLIKGAKDAVGQRRSILIFPEGTRTKPGTHVPYKQGVLALYQATGVKVIPAAHNAGYLWPRRGFLKKPGRLIFEFLPPIEPGLTGEAFMAKLQSTIEEACDRIATEAPNLRKDASKDRRRGLFKNPFSLLAITFLGAVTSYILLWLSAAQKLEDFIKSSAQELRKSEIEVNYDSFKVTGFPFHVLAKVKHPTITVPYLGKTELKVNGKIEIYSGVWHPKTLSFDIKGDTSLTYRPKKDGHPYAVMLEDLEGTFTYGPQGIERLTSIDLKSLKVKGKKSSVELGGLKLLIEPTPTEKTPSAKEIVIDLENLRLGLETHSPLDEKIESLKMKGILHGNLPLTSLREGLVAWAQAGGMIEMARLSFNWGKAKFKGEGAFVLDTSLQPMVTLAGEAEEVRETLADFVKAGLIKSQAAHLSQAITEFKENTKSQQVSLSLQNGELSLGPIVIAHLPLLEW